MKDANTHKKLIDRVYVQYFKINGHIVILCSLICLSFFNKICISISDFNELNFEII